MNDDAPRRRVTITDIAAELGVTRTEMLGLPQVPALAEGWCASPRWSP